MKKSLITSQKKCDGKLTFSLSWPNCRAGMTSGFSAIGRPAWIQNRVPAAKIGNPALQLGKVKSAGRMPVQSGFC